MSRISFLFILVLSLGTSIAWTIAAGQDLNFDLITYHYYLGYSAFVSRFQLDFLAAGFYGYQSPVPYMFLYWLDNIGVSPIIIAALHAAFHALNLVFLYLLTELLVGKPATSRKYATVILLWLLGVIAPIYWTLVGSSFADLSTSALVLGGLWLTAHTIAKERPLSGAGWAWIATGGILMGAAMGARVHNAIYVAGFVCALILTPVALRSSRARTLGVGAFFLTLGVSTQ
jgi:hypothetical protein